MVSMWMSEGNTAVLFEGFSLFIYLVHSLFFVFFFLPFPAT